MRTRSGIDWRIRGTLGHEDRIFLTTYVPTIYWNDIECRHWAFDVKLPSGRYLENMQIFLGEETRITASIFDTKEV